MIENNPAKTPPLPDEEGKEDDTGHYTRERFRLDLRLLGMSQVEFARVNGISTSSTGKWGTHPDRPFPIWVPRMCSISIENLRLYAANEALRQRLKLEGRSNGASKNRGKKVGAQKFLRGTARP